jgi:NDP-sugar pyrophosphorylase family protein
MVVEPNGNFYLDVDFAKLKQVLLKNISAEAIKALCIHESVQEFAVVDTNGELMADKINEFREKILIDCDFEKNPVLFAYSCQAMDELNLGIKLHSRLK